MGIYFTAAAALPQSPVADAAQNGDLAGVKKLIQEKADVNVQQADGATAIEWAAYRNDLALTDVLIAAGADVKKANREGATPMYLASIRGSALMLDRLLKAGANPNETGPQGETPLMLASRAGNLDAMKVLLEHKADVNAKEELRGTTPLMWASSESHPEAVKLLIEHGADVNAASKADTGGKPRNNLANPRSQRLNSAFGVNGRGRGTAGGGANAAAGGGANGGGRGRGGRGRGTNGGGNAAPGAAAGAEAALQNGEAGGDEAPGGAGVAGAAGAARGAAGGQRAGGFGGFGRGGGATDGGELTPLVYAAREDCLECVKLLLDAGANVNMITNYGWTPLLTATQNRHYKLAAFLLDHGANPNIVNKGGWSALYLATDNRNIEAGDYPVRTPDMDHMDFIRLLIDKGANVNQRVCGPASTATNCVGDSTETRTNFTMQWLFEEGATPFLRAAQSGDVEEMKLLLDHGADPKIYTAHNVTPLAVAAGIGWVEGVTYEWSEPESLQAVKMCLDLGIDPNIQDDEGRAALHGAAHKGDPKVIQVLVDHGAKMDMHDGGSRDTVNGTLVNETFIPLDWARGLVRVGVQSAIAHPDAEKLLVKLMTEKGIAVPPPPKNSRCLTVGIKGCS